MEYAKLIEKLIHVYCNDNDILELIEDNLKAYTSYVGFISTLESLIMRWRVNSDPADFRQKVMQADKQRRSKHNRCIDATNQFNRLCQAAELPLFYSGSINDRYQVSVFIGNVIHELYQKGIISQDSPASI